MDNDNPYRSPSTDAGEAPRITSDDMSHVQAVIVRRGIAFREIRLSGAIEALIEYNGRGIGYESVLVNGVVAVRARNWNWRPWAPLVPHLEFEIRTDARCVRARIDVKGILTLRAFRLFVGGVLVYSEGEW
jgi:hypothetical protein